MAFEFAIFLRFVLLTLANVIITHESKSENLDMHL